MPSVTSPKLLNSSAQRPNAARSVLVWHACAVLLPRLRARFVDDIRLRSSRELGYAPRERSSAPCYQAAWHARTRASTWRPLASAQIPYCNLPDCHRRIAKTTALYLCNLVEPEHPPQASGWKLEPSLETRLLVESRLSIVICRQEPTPFEGEGKRHTGGEPHISASRPL